MQSQFENIIEKVRGQRSVLTQMHQERYKKIEQQLKLTMQKYPESTQRKIREKLLKNELNEIKEEPEHDDEQDEPEQGPTHIANLLGDESRQKKKVAFASQEDEDDDAEGMEEIDFETYKKQFEAEMAEKIKLAARRAGDVREDPREGQGIQV